MKKPRIATCVLLLLVSLTPISSLLVNQVKATYGWDNGHNHAGVIHASDGGNPPNNYELAWVQWACDDIFNNAFAPRQYYLWFGEDWGYIPIEPAYGHLFCYMQGNRSQTTVANVFNGIDDCEVYHDTSTFLYIGHHAYDYWGGAWHYGFVEHGYGQDTRYLPKVWDVNVDGHIYYYYPSNHYFVFLWVCRNGNERGGREPYPPHGMPFVWTQEPDLGENGYDDPDGSGYCFIGFENMSPLLSSWMGTNGEHGQPNLYKHWLVFFYSRALYSSVPYQWYLERYTVKEALDFASERTGFGSFSQCILYQGNNTWWPGGDGQPAGWYWSKMRVYGDGDMYVAGDIYDGGGPLG